MPRSHPSSKFDIAKIKSFIREFGVRNNVALSRLGARQSQVFEVACATAAADHYAANGYAVNPLNPRRLKTFKVKTGARGHPADYSRFVITRDSTEFELHLNCCVRSGRDDGIYCVDVAVTPTGVLPRTKKRTDKWICAPNAELLTLIEAKRLPIYPMLVAQFIGIVHEILPRFIRHSPPPLFIAQRHFVPTLISIGSFSGNTRAIVAKFRSRRLRIRVLPNFDIRLARTTPGLSAWREDHDDKL